MGEISHWTLPILFRWRASLWKSVWRELSIYLLCYLAISLVYRLILMREDEETGERVNEQSMKYFEKVVHWFKNSAQLPLTFLLGFYVSLVVKRWWEQYVKLPWLDEVATYLKVAITKKKEKKEKEDDETEDNENLKIRRTIVRYCMLSYVLCLRRISSQVMHHYPSVENLVSRGLVREDEADLIGKEDPEDLHRHGGSNWWLPIKWSVDIIRTAQIDGRFITAPSYTALVGKVNDFRKCLSQVASYGHVTIPLVYTQVVHLAVYIHFAVGLVGDQWIMWRKDGDEEVDLYYPIFLTFKFL